MVWWYLTITSKILNIYIFLYIYVYIIRPEKCIEIYYCRIFITDEPNKFQIARAIEHGSIRLLFPWTLLFRKLVTRDDWELEIFPGFCGVQYDETCCFFIAIVFQRSKHIVRLTNSLSSFWWTVECKFIIYHGRIFLRKQKCILRFIVSILWLVSLHSDKRFNNIAIYCIRSYYCFSEKFCEFYIIKLSKAFLSRIY